MTWCDTLWQNNVWHYTFEKQRNCHKIVSIFCDLPHIPQYQCNTNYYVSSYFCSWSNEVIMKGYQVENNSEIIIQRYLHCAWWGLVHYIKPCALSWNELSKKFSRKNCRLLTPRYFLQRYSCVHVHNLYKYCYLTKNNFNHNLIVPSNLNFVKS